MHLRSEFDRLQEWHSIFGAENDVHQNKGERLGHTPLHYMYMLLSRSSCAPLGRVAMGGRFLGLKPRAESCSPFGAKTVPTPSLSLAPFGTGQKDADVLVTIDPAMDLSFLARFGRRLKGTAQTIDLGADIFLGDGSDHYLGRICHYRECHARVACRALHCGQRQHLNDDLQIVTLSPALISAPPIDLWPRIVRRCAMPPDTEALLAELENDETLRHRCDAAAQAPRLDVRRRIAQERVPTSRNGIG